MLTGGDNPFTMGDMHVLVVDDEEAVRVALERALTMHGYRVSTAGDGLEGRQAAVTDRPDLILLDIGMPNMDGLRMCRQMRSAGDNTPIIVLTARTRIHDRVEGLDAGADDYLVKPFALEELLARIRALVRRLPPAEDNDFIVTSGDLVLDTEMNQVRRASETIQLSRTECRLLELLMRNAGRVISKDEIFESVWGYDFGDSSNPHEVYIGYLRKKLEAGGHSRLIQTVRGSGYVLRAA